MSDRSNQRPPEAVSWSSVLRAVQSEKGRQALRGFSETLGFNRDAAGQKSSRVTFSELLSRVEDFLELHAPSSPDRARLRPLRRQA